ncbi:hypothetical protein GCM10010094_06730 [Streptomyces flaveus]|uniref:Uncharacterized protein n=1 Tax=Streptomyces flaveus TaxID=66370 RepID=A0A917QHF2_9ACTN|nr:hypothetical protein GCM10010094_06730 [Streptomyces flaveus]
MPVAKAVRETWSAARLQARRVASSAAACSGDGNSFTCTTSFTTPNLGSTSHAQADFAHSHPSVRSTGTHERIPDPPTDPRGAGNDASNHNQPALAKVEHQAWRVVQAGQAATPAARPTVGTYNTCNTTSTEGPDPL